MLDPATVIAGTQVAAGLFKMLSTSSDPSSVAVLETYRSVLAIHERLDGVEAMLMRLDEQVDNLPVEMRIALKESEARNQAAELAKSFESVVKAYISFQNYALSDRPFSEAKESYEGDLQDLSNDLSRSITGTILSSPLHLDHALAGVAMEVFVDRERNRPIDSVDRIAERRISKIEQTIEAKLDPIIEDAATYYSDQINALMELVSVPEDGRLREISVPAGSYLSVDMKYMLVLCPSVREVKIDEERGITLWELIDDGPRFAIGFSDETKIADSIICGVEVQGRGGQPYTLNGKKSNLAPTVKRSIKLRGTFNNVVQYFDATDFANKYQSNQKKALPAFKAVKLAIDMRNLAAARYALLASYRDGLQASISEFQGEMRKLSDMDHTELAELAFTDEIFDLDYRSLNATQDQTFALNSMSEKEKGVFFRRQVTEAGLAASVKVRAGAARYKRAVESYRTDRMRRVASTLQKMIVIIETAAAVDSMLSVETTDPMSAVPSVDARLAEVAAPSALRQPSGEPAGGHGDQRQITGPPAANGSPARINDSGPPKFPQGRPNPVRARWLIDQIAEIGIPEEGPQQTGVTQAEKYAAELADIFAGWGKSDVEIAYEDWHNDRAENVVWAILRPTILGVLKVALQPRPVGEQGLEATSYRDMLMLEAKPHLEELRDWRIEGSLQRSLD